MTMPSAGKLRPVVHANAPWLAARSGQTVELIDNLIRAKVGPRCTRESLSRMAVDNRQNPKRPAIEKSV